MSFYENNMNQIKLGFPELYEILLTIDEPKVRQDFMQMEYMETNAVQGATLVQKRDGEWMRLQSAYDPLLEASIWMDGQEKPDKANLLVFGLGNGNYAHEVVARKSCNSKVVIYEPSPQLFFFVLHHYDLREFFSMPGVRVIVDEVNDYMYSNVMEEMLNYETFEEHAAYVAPYMPELFPAQTKKFIEAYHDGVGRLMSNKNTTRRFIHSTPHNILHNLKYLNDSLCVPDLAKVWNKDVPILIVGAGPSLKEEVEILRTASERAYLFAVDSAMPFLLSRNILPDAMICIESDKPMWVFADERCKEVPLFCHMTTTSKLLDQHQTKKIFGYDDGFIETLYHRLEIPCSTYRYGGNGATSFFAIARELGAKTVVLVGQDMCYDENQQSHAGKRNEGFLQDDKFLCENNLGQTVQSRQDWYRFVRWYENAIPVCKFENVINTAMKGVKLSGTKVMSLKDALDTYGCEHEPLEKTLEKARASMDRERNFDVKAFYEECLKEWEKLNEVISRDKRAEERKELLLYQILELYEIADKHEDFEKSQAEGLRLIKQYIETELQSLS
ncbi:MAG: motility associated factor glycosyltransferase family protein [Eubacterium sp.]|nr:motility associated factor glycosyltransferase family protein [Eubacterium sp.]